MGDTEISHYRLEEKLLDSPTGPLYKALDTRTGRTVALKVIPADLGEDAATRQRFAEEVRAAGSLDSPAISAVHEIGKAPDGRLFVAMEFTEGQTLRAKLASGPLPLTKALSMGARIARALAAAHAKGIVHRDIQPGTVLIDEAETTKLLDFGLSRLVDAATQTRTAELSGDQAYQAPELLLGQEIDTRADIWSVGALLSESLGGKSGKVPEELRRIVDRCLRKDPRERYESAAELADDLEAVAAGLVKGTLKSVKLHAAPRQPRPWAVAGAIAGAAVVVAAALVVSLWWKPWQPRTQERVTIALLPLEGVNLSDEDAWYAKGVTDSLTTNLVKVRKLRIIGRTSAQVFKTNDDVREVGQRLKCDYVTSGTVTKTGEEVTISLAMSRVEDARRLWSRSFSYDASELFGDNEEIVRAICSAARVRLNPERSTILASGEGVSPEAYELYVKGQMLGQETGSGMLTAITYLEKVVELEPEWAAGWSALAQTYWGAAEWPPEGVDRAEMLRKRQVAEEKALAFNTEDAYVHAALGMRAFEEFDWETTEYHWNIAHDMDPIQTRQDLFYTLKRFDEAYADAEELLRIEPEFYVAVRVAGIPYYYGRKFDRALELWEEVLRMEPDSSIDIRNLGALYCAMGKTDEGIALLEKAQAMGAYNTEFWLGNWYARTGNREGALACLEKALKDTSYPVMAGSIYVGLGDFENAMVQLENQYTIRTYDLFVIGIDPVFDPIRSYPPFRAFMTKCGLPE